MAMSTKSLGGNIQDEIATRPCIDPESNSPSPVKDITCGNYAACLVISSCSDVLLTVPDPRRLSCLSCRALHDIREAAHVTLASATAEYAWPAVSRYGLVQRWFGW